MEILQTLLFSVSVTAPILGWMLAGTCLRQLGWLNAVWRGRFNALIFYVSLPLLMFVSISRRPLHEVWEPQLTLILCGTTLLIFYLAQSWSRRQQRRSEAFSPLDGALVSQASFRGNLGIIGIYLCLNTYGEAALPVASLLMALLSILYNGLSVWVFESAQQQTRGANSAASPWHLWINILLNPLILATLVALLLNAAGVEVPTVALTAGEGFVALTLPLALLCIGATLEFGGVNKLPAVETDPSSRAQLRVSALLVMLMLKLLLMPLVAVLFGWLVGFRGMALGTVFFLAASPTAAASYVVAKAYGANETLAARVIVLSSVLSLLSISAGVFILRALSWI